MNTQDQLKLVFEGFRTDNFIKNQSSQFSYSFLGAFPFIGANGLAGNRK
jgi:hypothetical protein